MLRWRLVLPATIVALGLGLVLTAIGYWQARTIGVAASEQVVRHCVGALSDDIADLLRRSNRTLFRVENEMIRYKIPLDDPKAVLRELYAVVTDEPYVDWVFFANEAGGQVSAGREADGSKVFVMTDDFRAGILREFKASPDGQPGRLRKGIGPFDSRSQIWYERAKQQSRYWTQSYLGQNDQMLGIALTAPIGSEREVAGVIGVRVLLSSLAERLNSRCVGYTGRMFILGPGGQLVASSGGLTRAGGDRHAATAAADAVVRETASYLLAHLTPTGSLAGPGLQTFSFEGEKLGETYAATKGFQVPGEIAWTAVAAMPLSDFLGAAQHALLVSLGLSLSVVALTLALGIWLAGRSLRPLSTLTRVAQSITRGEWRDVPEAERNDEVGLLARAFSRMTASLRDSEESLRRSEADYRSFFENTIEGILRTTLDGRVLSVNPAAVRMLGFASAQELVDEITNTSEQLWVIPGARETLIARLFNEGDAVSGFEAELKRKDGGRITALFNTRVIRDGKGRPLHIETFITDITERKRSEMALMDARAELAHFARVTTLGEMSASIAHEVTQPLTAASLNAQAGLRWLANSPANVAEARLMFDAVVKDTQRAGEVIQRIRALASRTPPERNWLDLNDIIREVAAMMDSEVYRHQIELSLQIDETIPPVMGDRVQLQQVMINLVVNAMEAIDAAGPGRRELTICSGLDEAGQVLVTVRDSGIGIAPERFTHLFDAFSSTKATGMGMGLRISRTIVEAHDGRLWAAANAPRGMVFSFTLPAGEQAAPRKASAGA
jgi:PAS domain S-box-containing protein